MKTTKGTVALEVNLPEFKDYKVGRLISLSYKKYDQRGRSPCYTKYKLTEINLSAKCGTNNTVNTNTAAVPLAVTTTSL